MVVIYDHDKTYISESAEDVRKTLVSLYGSRIGEEAYSLIRNAAPGTSFRRNGGPLVQVVDSRKAEQIMERERKIGML